ncbi:MAG: hypothetical protein KKC46_19375 [Proteobacteria bacterium]|nr:hypothetical protein [Pseudomonadota bacterium]
MSIKIPFSSRQRMLKAVYHEITDRIPKGELCITDEVISRELNCSNVGFEERLEFVNLLGLDAYTISPIIECEKDKLPNPKEVKWPDIEKWRSTSLFTFAIMDGALETGMRIQGWVDFLKLTKKSPSSIVSFVDMVEKLNISIFRNLSQKGIDGIILADDVAFSQGLIVNPETIRKYFLPSLARQVEEIRRLGIFAFYHSDGNYQEIIPDLIDINFHGIQCIEKHSGMDIVDLQKKYGDKICLWGHIDTDDTLKASTHDYLQKYSDSLSMLSKKKGLILGTNCGLYKGTDIAGLKAIYQSIEV